jgi:hypothetical protein
MDTRLTALRKEKVMETAMQMQKEIEALSRMTSIRKAVGSSLIRRRPSRSGLSLAFTWSLAPCCRCCRRQSGAAY